MAAELRAQDVGGLIVADLGTRAEPPLPGMPTVLLDHHVPAGVPQAALLVSGYGLRPTPTTSSVLVVRRRNRRGGRPPLARGARHHRGHGGGAGPELAAARERWGITALRKAVSLLNAPRRASAGDAGPALALLLKADGPKAVLSGEHPETASLEAAKAEVQDALQRAVAWRLGFSVRWR